MTRKRTEYMADFETTTDPNDCRVWAYGLCEVDDYEAFSVGTSITHFLGIAAREDCVIYFHNLKFDGGFILDWLFRNDYKHSEKQNPKPGEFTSLISRMGQWYTLTVRWKTGTKTEFRDSLKKLPMTVKRVAESFKLDQMKGEIDYHKPRPLGYVPDDDEIDYIRNDVQIMAKALQVQKASTKGKLTVGADALAEFKEMTGHKLFQSFFPVLPIDIDTNIRAAYRGGWTYVAHDRQQIVQGAGHVFDVNSLYPSVMFSDVLPYGFPEFFTGEPEPTKNYPLWVASITFTAELRDDRLPCIQIKNSFHFADTEYLKVIDEPTTLTITNIDFDLWNEHYDIEVMSWNGGFMFRGASGFFDTYINKWSTIKANNSGGLREIAKLHLNSLYGKFATNPNITGKVPVFDPDKNIVRFVVGPDESRDPVYTPMGAFITAYARRVTIEAAQANYASFAYADTDSLHLITDVWPDNLDIDPKKMGAWKHEYSFTRAYYARAKAYSEQLVDGSYETRIAGLPRDIASGLVIEDLRDGASWSGKLIPRYVPGGIVLTDTDYTLKF